MTSLSTVVRVERRFARSGRIDADLQTVQPLVGYVLQPSVRRALENMVDGLLDGRQGAFTWTGPYGGGKSCAALLVANLIAGGAEARELARDIAGTELANRFAQSFPETDRGWGVIALTGRRIELRRALAAAAGSAFGWTSAEADLLAGDDRMLVERLEAEAAARDGVLLLVDELGKFLEHAVVGDGDVHLLQDLAEKASRSSGRLVVVGLLHQSFEQYAGRLGKGAREDWAKVQGRYLDLPFVAGADETAALISCAVQADQVPEAARSLAAATAEAVASRRPVDPDALRTVLAAAWPLHPVTTLLLGPVSRQRFAQNERSVFGFLASAEPHGFQAHLAATSVDAPPEASWFRPDQLWDYLVANFGSALAAGAEGGRVALAMEAVERAALRGELHCRLVKVAALIELFRNGSGLAVADDILALCVPDAARGSMAEALADLVERAVLIRQPRVGGYALFAGSDFDLDEAIAGHREPPNAAMIADLPARLQIGPVAAKRHYVTSGALRTFDVLLQLGEDAETDVGGWARDCADRLARTRRNTTGLLVLLLPDGFSFGIDPLRAAKALSAALESAGVVAAVGAVRSMLLLREYATDLYAMDRLDVSHPQLEGDRIARREVAARRSQVVDAVRRELSAALSAAIWFGNNAKLKGLDGAPLSIVASRVAQIVFAQTPTLHSELLYRDRPSTNAMAALRALLYAMIARAAAKDLGMEGFPPERGLYLTVLHPFGLHRPAEDGTWRFHDPDASDAGASLRPAWDVAAEASGLSLGELYARWAAPPYGIKRGVMPVLALAFLLAHRSSTAVYLEGVYQPQLDEVCVDRLLQDPASMEFRHVRHSQGDRAFVSALAHLLGEGGSLEPKALPVASRLYQRFRSLPAWAQRTQSVPAEAARIRDIVLKASDPEALLFKDLLAAVRDEAEPAGAVVAALKTCENAYASMLAGLRQALADQLGLDPITFEGIGPRAAAAGGVTADLRFDAFALRAAAFEGGSGDVEGLASLLVHKPARSWTDREQQQALFELARLTRRFREAETLAALKGRDPTAEAISLAVGLDPRTGPVVHAFEVTVKERREAERLADALIAALAAGKRSSSVVQLAALARVVQRLGASRGEDAV